MSWVSVDNILPTPGIKVLTVNNYGWYKIDQLTPDNLWESVLNLNKFLGVNYLEADRVVNVTHWMYLPDKP